MPRIYPRWAGAALLLLMAICGILSIAVVLGQHFALLPAGTTQHLQTVVRVLLVPIFALLADFCYKRTGWARKLYPVFYIALVLTFFAALTEAVKWLG